MALLQRRRWLGGLTAATLCVLLPGAVQAQLGKAWLLIGLGTGAERPYRSSALSLRGPSVEGVGTARLVLRYPAEPGWSGKAWPWRTPQSQGELLLLALTPGEYEVEGFELVQQTGDTARVDRSLRPLGIRLRIRAGELVYAGHYEAWDRGAPDGPEGVQGVLLLSDRAEAARSLLARQSLPGLEGGTLHKQVPQPAKLQHPQLLESLGER